GPRDVLHLAAAVLEVEGQAQVDVGGGGGEVAVEVEFEALVGDVEVVGDAGVEDAGGAGEVVLAAGEGLDRVVAVPFDGGAGTQAAVGGLGAGGGGDAQRVVVVLVLQHRLGAGQEIGGGVGVQREGAHHGEVAVEIRRHAQGELPAVERRV